MEKKSCFSLRFPLYVSDGCHGDVLVSSAEALGCVWEMSHSHRWSPVGSLFMFGFQVVKERINGLLKNMRYRMENPRGDTMLQEGGVGLLLGVRGRRVWGGGRLHSRH